MIKEVDAFISDALGRAVARPPQDQYEIVTDALERHEARIAVIEDGDSVIVTVEDVPLVRVARLAFVQGRGSAGRN
jgi:hypothetical protein